MSSPAIVINALEKLFPPARSGWRTFLQPFETPDVPALAGISLKIAEGESVALLGSNGAGKSTLLRILATLLLPSKGTASVAGHDIARDPSAIRRSLGYHSGNDAGFYPRLTARQNLLFFGQLNFLSRGAAEKRIAEITEQFNLEEVIDRQVRTLSSGTVQRLSLARALLHRPSVLLLDEPTRSLDVIGALDFRNFLKSQIINAGHTTVLFASHALPEVEQLANRIAVIESGRLVACASSSELQRQSDTNSLERAFFKLTGHRPQAVEATLS